jgi:hypothetical protein
MKSTDERSKQVVKTGSQERERVTRTKTSVIERGDIFFFYRPKVDRQEVQDIEDVQRFYMVMSPQSRNKHRIHRIFLIGEKQLPEIVEGAPSPEERNWALNIITTSDLEEIGKEFLPAEYETKTRGRRMLSAAVPVGEGKYAIVEHEGHTELGYILELPEVLGRTQKVFRIKKEASYIISVKNPEIQVKGYSSFLKRKPRYSKHLREKFGNKRWINVDDPDLLNYEDTQILLIGARQKNVEHELGIELTEEKESITTSELFRELKISKEQIPLKPLLEGEFPKKEEIPIPTQVKRLSPEDAPGRGGKIGGKIAANNSPSAAAVAKILSGIHFPKNKKQLLEYAEQHKGKIPAGEAVLQTLRELPDNILFKNMADVEKTVGLVR